MKSDKNHIEKQLQSKFEGAKLTPPAAIWDNIAAQLPPEKVVAIPFYAQNWFRAVAVLFLVVGLSSLFVWKYHNSLEETPLLETEKIEQQEELSAQETQKRLAEQQEENNTFSQENNPNPTTFDKETRQAKNNQENTEKIASQEQVTVVHTTTIDTKENFLGQTVTAPTSQETSKQLTTFTHLQLTTTFANSLLAYVKNDLPSDELPLQLRVGPVLENQANEQVQHNTHRFSLGFSMGYGSISPNYSGEPNNQVFGIEPTGNELVSTIFSKLTTGNLTGSQWSAGLDMGYNLSKKWRLNTGLYFNRSKFEVSENVEETIVIGSDLQSPITRTDIYNNTLTANWQNISVPISLSYEIGSKRLTASLSAGTTANFVLKNDFQSAVSRFSYQTGNQKNTYFNSLIGLGLNYRLSPQWSWSLGMNYQSSLNSLLEENNVKLRPDAYQFGTGLRFSF